MGDRYQFLAHCHRCKQPIERTPRSEEPTICGPCWHKIHDAAGRDAVRAYCEQMRVDVNLSAAS